MSTSTDTSDGDPSGAFTVHENAQNLLLALYDAENQRASTSDLKEPTDLTAANISGRHAKTLIREGWAKKVGKEDVGAREDANVYEITPEGQREANRLLKRKPVPMSEEDRTLMVQNLRDRVEELEEQVEENENQSVPDDLAEQVESNTEAIEDHQSSLDRAHRILEKVVNQL